MSVAKMTKESQDKMQLDGFPDVSIKTLKGSLR